MNKKFYLFLFFVLSVFCLPTLKSEDNEDQACDASLASLFTPNVTSYRKVVVPLETMAKKTGAQRDIEVVELRTLDERRFSEKELFNEPSDLIVGIDVMGNTQGHTYLVINGIRVDGRMFFAPHTEIQDGWTLSNGLIIRYRKLPKENLEAITNWLAEPTILKTPTCVAAACRILYDIGALEPAPPSHYWFPSRLLKHLAHTGLTGGEAERIQPEIYTINRDVYKIWANLPDWKSVPFFIFKVLFDPYTWKGAKRDGLGKAEK